MTEIINIIFPDITSIIFLTICLLSFVAFVKLFFDYSPWSSIVFIMFFTSLMIYVKLASNAWFYEDEYSSTIESLENNYTGVVFFCEERCKEFEDTKEIIESESKKANIKELYYNTNHDMEDNTNNNYDITKYPTVIAFQNGVETKRIEGEAQSKTYRQLINSIPETNHIIE